MFCQVLLPQDMPLLGLQPDAVSHASDYFGAMIADATALIESGLLYADDTPVELVSMQVQRRS
jgi:glutamyl/glutaminyl-tRNA synthetase